MSDKNDTAASRGRDSDRPAAGKSWHVRISPDRPRRTFQHVGSVDGAPAPRTNAPVAGKKWLRTPLLGPAHVICYDCDTEVFVGYFGLIRRCPECHGNRFQPSA